MKDNELFDLILSYSDFDRILRDNPEISPKDIDKLKNRVKKYLHKEGTANKCLHLYVDGASKGNPGESGIGAVIKDGKNNVIEEYCEYIGINTNNVAEYKALIFGLEKTKILNPSDLKIFSDSQLLVNQINGIYKVKNPKLIELYWKAVNLLKDFKLCKIIHIPREKNKRADKLANLSVKKK